MPVVACVLTTRKCEWKRTLQHIYINLIKTCRVLLLTILITSVKCMKNLKILFTSENIIFQKTNEMYINGAHWFATFIYDLRSHMNLTNQKKMIIKCVIVTVCSSVIHKQ